MKVKLINNEREYDAALERADEIFDAEPGTTRGDELGLLLLTIKDYEDKHHQVPVPDPIEALKLKMQEQGWTLNDLKWIGGKSYVSQVLNKKKPLTADMMRKIWERRLMPAEVILGMVKSRRSAALSKIFEKVYRGRADKHASLILRPGISKTFKLADDVEIVKAGLTTKKSIKKTREERLS